MSTHCVFFRADTEKKHNGQEVHECQIKERCITVNGDANIASCDKCKDKLPLDDPKFADKWLDPLIVTDRKKNHTSSIRNLLAGRSVFLVGGGPSVNDLNLDLLKRRGVWSLAINNVAAHSKFQVQAFVCSDPLTKFSSSIWLDPKIMKFVPLPKLKGGRAKLRRKKSDGSFERLNKRAYDCPSVWGFHRWSWMTPDNDFFLETGAMWGNHNAGVKRTGQPKTVCTMLLGLRLLRYLGARVIFLLGCDFLMAEGYGYSFDQGRTEGACKSNNAQFMIVNKWLVEMQESGVFKQFGLEIYNTFRNSGLRAFPYVPFTDAIEDVTNGVEEVPNLSSWYEK